MGLWAAATRPAAAALHPAVALLALAAALAASPEQQSPAALLHCWAAAAPPVTVCWETAGSQCPCFLWQGTGPPRL